MSSNQLPERHLNLICHRVLVEPGCHKKHFCTIFQTKLKCEIIFRNFQDMMPKPIRHVSTSQ